MAAVEPAERRRLNLFTLGRDNTELRRVGPTSWTEASRATEAVRRRHWRARRADVVSFAPLLRRPLEVRVETAEDRLDRAAAVVGDVARRLGAVERKLSGGAVVTEDQAAEVSQAVKALAALLTDDASGGRNPYQAVFGELYRRFGVSSYKNIRADRLPDVLAWLEDWRRRVAGGAIT